MALHGPPVGSVDTGRCSEPTVGPGATSTREAAKLDLRILEASPSGFRCLGAPLLAVQVAGGFGAHTTLHPGLQ